MTPSTTATMFSSASDEWSTPQEFFDKLNEEFHFDLDAAASEENNLCRWCFTKDYSALEYTWITKDIKTVWLNPPYSQLRAFVAKASEESKKGCTVVMLIPSRTDTRAFHDYIWDESTNSPRPGVEIRFVKGRLKFGGSKTPAPFPSMVVIFRPPNP